jgi:purine-cytosine permease-like protein
MDTNTVFLAILVVIGFAIATVWFDRFMHNRERPNFAAGVTITAFAICGFLILFNGHHNLTHKATTLILFALILFVLAGNLLIDKNNIDDQEGGLMSKWGTWWDSGDDNYFSNIIDKWQTWAFICVVGWLMFSVAVNRDIDDDNAAIAATTSNAVVAKTPAPSQKTKHKTQTGSKLHQSQHNSTDKHLSYTKKHDLEASPKATASVFH